MWRAANPEDDDRIVSLCRNLNQEDPGHQPVSIEQIRCTLRELRTNPVRGTVLVLEVGKRVECYAFLISFWSNELGGEICNIDELYISPRWRRQGHGRALVKMLCSESRLWPRKSVAIELEISPENAQARAFYAKLGFKSHPNVHMQLILNDDGSARLAR
jgi:ribosomal protein S18 acetylase RimI-like enzyme